MTPEVYIEKTEALDAKYEPVLVVLREKAAKSESFQTNYEQTIDRIRRQQADELYAITSEFICDEVKEKKE